MEKTLLADIGLHALARRYQRGDRSNETVLNDLAPIAHGYRAIMPVVISLSQFRVVGGVAWLLGLTGNL
jgi:hypothetical protein